MEIRRAADLSWLLCIFAGLSVVVAEKIGTMFLNGVSVYVDDNHKFHNLSLNQHVETNSLMSSYVIEPIMKGAKALIVARFSSPENSKYADRDGTILGTLHTGITRPLQNIGSLAHKSEAYVRGIVRHIKYYQRCVDIELNGATELLKGYSAVIIGVPDRMLTDEQIELKMSDPNADPADVANVFKHILAAMVNGMGFVVPQKFISNRYHPSRLGVKIKFKDTKSGLLSYYVTYTDFSFGSNLQYSALEETSLYTKPELFGSKYDFPIRWVGDEIETLDLYSLKGGVRYEATEKASLVFSALRLIHELPFYTIHIKNLLNNADKEVRIWGTYEMVRTHLTLAPNAIYGKFNRLYRHYQRNSKYWKLLGMDDKVLAFKELFKGNGIEVFKAACAIISPSVADKSRKRAAKQTSTNKRVKG